MTRRQHLLAECIGMTVSAILLLVSMAAFGKFERDGSTYASNDRTRNHVERIGEYSSRDKIVSADGISYDNMFF